MVLSENDVVQPDILFVSARRLSIVRMEGVFGPPDLVVEVLSSTSIQRDLQEKLALYTRHGVREYWIADPENHAMNIWSGKESPLDSRIAIAGAEDVIKSEVLPGLTFTLADIFAGIG